jgi:hypothetical protein
MKYLAQLDLKQLEGVGATNFKGKGPADIVSSLIDYIYPLGGLLVLVYLIFAGFQYMTSYGDPKAIAAAQQRITWAIVGFLVLFLAYWITTFIGNALNIGVTDQIFK